MSRTQQLANAKITGKQVGLLFAVAAESGLDVRGAQGLANLLEWLEFESGLGLELSQPEDLPASMLNTVLARLRER